MSGKGNAAPKGGSDVSLDAQPDKETLVRALDLCAHMGPEEWEFIVTLPLPAAEPLDTDLCIQRGTVTRAGQWVTITEEGLRRLDPRVPRSWFLALARVPSRGALQRLVRDGVIVNARGFPALTAFGEVVRAQIVEGQAYFAAHPEMFEDLGED